MKITIENFNFKGHSIKRYEGVFPQLSELDEAFENNFFDYLYETLTQMIEDEES